MHWYKIMYWGNIRKTKGDYFINLNKADKVEANIKILVKL